MSYQLGYIKLLQENRSFRFIWLGQVVSLLGDWFNSVALLVLVHRLTGSGLMVGGVFIARMLPAFFLGPVAGVVADRLDRKRVMIASDVLRAGVVLLFLLVRDGGDIWLLYGILFLSMSISSFFDPARSAAVPGIVSRKQLLVANALGGATWSVMLAFGSALGGVVVASAGFRMVFLLDSATFLLSAWFISQARVPRAHLRHKKKMRWLGFEDMFRGFAFLGHNPVVLATVLVKTGWGIAGGLMLLLTLFGEEVLAGPFSGEITLGLLFAARGVGAAVGPILVRRFFRETTGMIRWMVTAGFIINGCAYLVFSGMASISSALVWVVIAHIGGSLMWVFSTMSLQLMVPDHFRGRVFAAEMALLTVAIACSNYGVGLLLDGGVFTIRQLTFGLGAWLLIPGFLWGILQSWRGSSWDRRMRIEPTTLVEVEHPEI
jgi:MFS family permease